MWISRTILAVALGAVTTASAAWLVAARGSFAAPRRITFQPVREADDRVCNVLRIQYPHAEVIVARWNDEHSYPATLSVAEQNLIDSMYAFNTMPDDETRVEWLPVVTRAEELNLTAASGIREWLEKARVAASREDGYRIEQLYGWPFPTMRCALRPSKSFSGWELIVGTTGAEIGKRSEVNPAWLPSARVLPMTPAIGPFALSTLLFAGAWMLPFVLAHLASKVARRVGGRCPHCGYNLLDQLEQGCPECGWRRDGE